MNIPAESCPSCHNPLTPGAKFCRSCGAHVEPADATACRDCGHLNPADSRFCRACGSVLATSGADTTSVEERTQVDLRGPVIAEHLTPTAGADAPSSPPRSRSRPWVPVAVAVAALAIVAGATAGIVTFAGGHPKPKPSAPSAQAAVTTTSSSSSATTPTSAVAPVSSSTTTQTVSSQTTTAAPSGTSSYNEGDFTAAPPVAWRNIENGKPHDGYVESKWLSPGDPHTFVLVDMSPTSGLPPDQAAAVVRSQVSREDGYQEMSFGPATDVSQIGTTEWTFQLPQTERVDWFFSVCNHDFAVLGATAPGNFDRMLSTFTSFANSVQGTCGQ